MNQDVNGRPAYLVCFIVASIWLFIFGCATTSQVTQETCNFIPSEEKPPDWVVGDNHLAGYYVGIGQAEKKHADSHPEEIIQHARSMALDNLAQNIQVNIKSELKVSSIHNEDNHRITFSESIQSDVLTNANITISNIHQDDLWLDQKQCIVWIRLKVKQSSVDHLFMLSQAESNYEQASHSDLSLKDRLQKIEESIHLIQSINFSDIPSKGQASVYLTKYETLRVSLLEQSAGRQIMYVVQGSDIPQTVINDFVAQLINAHQNVSSWYEKDLDCPMIETCLDVARANQSLILVYIQITTKVSHLEMGFFKGDLILGLTIYDVKTSQQLFQRTSDQMKSLSHEQKNISWEKILNTLMAEHFFDAIIKMATNQSRER